MRQPFERLLVGRTLAGRYEIGEPVGAGGMSVVFRAMDRTLGRPVAVKVVALPADSDAMRDNLRERFRREAASAASISHHPNVVQVYDYGTDAELDIDFIVMELLRGHDLKERIAGGPLPLAEALRVLREAARGVAAGHRAGIVHRDVKPGNIFLVGESGAVESVRVLDFGIAKPLRAEGEDVTSLTTIGQLPHSPAYASPEQIDPEAPVGFASDVYQLGLVGYELLTGERAYTDADRRRIRAGEEVPPANTPRWAAVPPAVRATVERALALDPAARFPDATAFVEALAEADDRTLSTAEADEDATRTVAMPVRSVVAPVPIVVEPAPPPAAHVPAPAATRRRRSPLLWAAPLLLLAAVALWAATRGDDRERPGGDSTAVATLPPDTGAVAELEETFVRLQGEVATRSAGAPADPAAAALDSPGTNEAQTEEERELAEEVQRAIHDLNQSWVEGDLDRHMRHYAERVDYYNEPNATRDFIRQDRRASLRAYDDRTMTIERMAVTFPAPDRARALVDKSWDLRGDEGQWRGAERQELVLVRRDGRWLVVREKDNEVFRSTRVRN